MGDLSSAIIKDPVVRDGLKGIGFKVASSGGGYPLLYL